MRRCVIAIGIGFSALVFVTVASTPAAGQQSLPCATDSRPPAGEGVVAETARNTLVFDHYHLAATRKGPHVLAVRDGGYFQVRVVCTDSRKFNYTITANTEAEQKVALQGVVADRVDTNDLSRQTAVTMRHSRLFTRYRVEISLRDDLKAPASGARTGELGGGQAPPRTLTAQEPPYVLYSTFFDVWVDTLPEWTVDFSGGIAFSGLRGHEFFIKTDTKSTADTNDDVKTVEEDAAARSSFRPDIIALANVRHPKLKGVGVAFGVGLNNDADPRYFLGGSYLLGGKFIFNAGWAGGKVSELPVGQELHAAPINGDNTLTTPAGRFRNAFYVGVAFTFVDRGDQFKGAFGSAQQTKSEETTAKPPANEEAALLPEPSLDDLIGTYTQGSDNVIIGRQGDTLTIKLTANGTVEALTRDAALTYHIGSAADRKITFKRDVTGKIAAVEYLAGGKGATYRKSTPR